MDHLLGDLRPGQKFYWPGEQPSWGFEKVVLNPKCGLFGDKWVPGLVFYATVFDGLVHSADDWEVVYPWEVTK